MIVLNKINGQPVLVIGDLIERVIKDHPIVTYTSHWYSFKTNIHCIGCALKWRAPHKWVPMEILKHRISMLNVSLW